MLRQSSSILAAAILLGSAGGVLAHPHGELEKRVAQLEKQNAALSESLVAANQREKESADALAKIRLRLTALGENLFDAGNDRHVQAVADQEVLSRQLRELEDVALLFSASVQSYLKTAVASDPVARAEVEARIRELQATLGLRNKPEREIVEGNLQQAKVASIDPASGLLVMTAGSEAGVKIGMVFEVKRGEDLVADAVVAETRDAISGLLLQKLYNDQNPVQLGDLTSLKIQ